MFRADFNIERAGLAIKWIIVMLYQEPVQNLVNKDAVQGKIERKSRAYIPVCEHFKFDLNAVIHLSTRF